MFLEVLSFITKTEVLHFESNPVKKETMHASTSHTPKPDLFSVEKSCLYRFCFAVHHCFSHNESLLFSSMSFIQQYAPKFSSLRELSKNVILTVKVHLIAIDFNLGATILGKEDSIASLESRSMKIARNVANARSDGNYLALIGALGLVRGEVDTTSGLSLLGRSSDQDPVTKGSKGASEGLHPFMKQYPQNELTKGIITASTVSAERKSTRRYPMKYPVDTIQTKVIKVRRRCGN